MKYSCVGEEGKVEEGEGRKGRDKGGRVDQTYLSRFSSNTVASRLRQEGYGHQTNRCDVIDLV